MSEIDNGFYMCPISGGAYKHQRAKYFGPYAEKQVGRIFEISGLVIIKKGQKAFIVDWNNCEDSNEILIQKAKDRDFFMGKEWRFKENTKVDLQMFILENPAKTSFKKIQFGV